LNNISPCFYHIDPDPKFQASGLNKKAEENEHVISLVVNAFEIWGLKFEISQ
jgi:hypothetical protein